MLLLLLLLLLLIDLPVFRAVDPERLHNLVVVAQLRQRLGGRERYSGTLSQIIFLCTVNWGVHPH